jgi:SAM-dependent methyltransferase
MPPQVSNYGAGFESGRRLTPRLWDVDYCLLRGMRRAVTDFVAQHVRPESTVVDFGCGGKPYRPLFPSDCRYIGVDAAQSRFADILIAPGDPVPLDDGTVDCIISTQVVYLIPDYRIYLDECRRLLGPDGRLFLTSHGTWTYHPASGGDYYRFTQDGLRRILDDAGLEVIEMGPIVGTLGAGLHLRQLVFDSWLRKAPILGSLAAKLMNMITNARILIEDHITPHGTAMSSPVIFWVSARPKS